MQHLGAVDTIVFAVYLILVFCLALLSMKGQRDNEDYFLAGRRMNWMVVGISMFATSFSSISFLGLPQRGAYQDFSFYLTILFIPLLIAPILWFFFVPLYDRLQVSSGYEYLRIRFGSGVQRVGSLLYCGYAVGWMGAVLYAIALTLKTVLALNGNQYLAVLVGVGIFSTIYTALGGLRAVVWTDVLQAVTLGGSVVIVLLIAVSGVPSGWKGLWDIGLEHGRWSMIHLNADLLAPENFTSAKSVYTALAFAVFMYLPGYAVAQNMIQRYVCAGGISQGRGVVVMGAMINAALGLIFLAVGVALFVYYMQPGGPGMPVLETEDQLLPYFVSTQAPDIGLAGLILAGLFAAAMSTVDSGINGVASVIVYDWLGGRQLPLSASRVLTVVIGMLVTAAALAVPLLGDNVIDIINTIAGTLLGGLLAIFLLGMFSTRTNTPGVLIGLVSGAISMAVVIASTDVPKWWYGAFTVFPTLLVGIVASRWFQPPSSQALVDTVLFPKWALSRHKERL